MPKNNISPGMRALMGQRKEMIEREEQEREVKEKERQKQTPGESLVKRGGHSRISDRVYTSLIVNRTKYEKVKVIAARNNLNISDIIDAAIGLGIESYERANGAITLRDLNISAENVLRSGK